MSEYDLTVVSFLQRAYHYHTVDVLLESEVKYLVYQWVNVHSYVSLLHGYHTVNNVLQWNPSIKATQDGSLWKEVACHEG